MMKKILTLALLLLSLALFGCGQDSTNYIGYWQGETNMIFEVLTENGSDYIIRNMNGDLKATISDGALRGKNSLDMEYLMRVKKDSAYYEFGGITTGYKRITEEEYKKIMATMQKAAISQ